MRITLNLATRPFVDVGPSMRRLRIAIGALALASLLLVLGLHFLHEKAEEARARAHSLDGAIAKITAERQGYQAMMAQPQNAEFIREVDELNQLFAEKSFSWTLAMESLETELPGGVQVTQIEPARSKEGKITLHLRVVGPHDLSDDLVRNLEHSTRFASPRIVGESAESASGSNQHFTEPVSASNRFEFDLLADYIPPTPEEERSQAGKGEKSPAPEAEGEANTPASTQPPPGANGRTGREPYTGPGAPLPAAPRGVHHPSAGGPK